MVKNCLFNQKDTDIIIRLEGTHIFCSSVRVPHSAGQADMDAVGRWGGPCLEAPGSVHCFFSFWLLSSPWAPCARCSMCPEYMPGQLVSNSASMIGSFSFAPALHFRHGRNWECKSTLYAEEGDSRAWAGTQSPHAQFDASQLLLSLRAPGGGGVINFVCTFYPRLRFSTGLFQQQRLINVGQLSPCI